MRNINEHAFANCVWLEQFEMVVNESNINQPVNFFSYAFYGCSNLINVILPLNTRLIGDYCFEDCIKLTGLDIPSSVKILGNYGAYTGNLTKLTLNWNIEQLKIFTEPTYIKHFLGDVSNINVLINAPIDSESDNLIRQYTNTFTFNKLNISNLFSYYNQNPFVIQQDVKDFTIENASENIKLISFLRDIKNQTEINYVIPTFIKEIQRNFNVSLSYDAEFNVKSNYKNILNVSNDRHGTFSQNITKTINGYYDNFYDIWLDAYENYGATDNLTFGNFNVAGKNLNYQAPITKFVVNGNPTEEYQYVSTPQGEITYDGVENDTLDIVWTTNNTFMSSVINNCAKFKLNIDNIAYLPDWVKINDLNGTVRFLGNNQYSITFPILVQPNLHQDTSCDVRGSIKVLNFYSDQQLDEQSFTFRINNIHKQLNFENINTDVNFNNSLETQTIHKKWTFSNTNNEEEKIISNINNFYKKVDKNYKWLIKFNRDDDYIQLKNLTINQDSIEFDVSLKNHSLTDKSYTTSALQLIIQYHNSQGKLKEHLIVEELEYLDVSITGNYQFDYNVSDLTYNNVDKNIKKMNDEVSFDFTIPQTIWNEYINNDITKIKDLITWEYNPRLSASLNVRADLNYHNENQVSYWITDKDTTKTIKKLLMTFSITDKENHSFHVSLRKMTNGSLSDIFTADVYDNPIVNLKMIFNNSSKELILTDIYSCYFQNNGGKLSIDNLTNEDLKTNPLSNTNLIKNTTLFYDNEKEYKTSNLNIDDLKLLQNGIEMPQSQLAELKIMIDQTDKSISFSWDEITYHLANLQVQFSTFDNITNNTTITSNLFNIGITIYDKIAVEDTSTLNLVGYNNETVFSPSLWHNVYAYKGEEKVKLNPETTNISFKLWSNGKDITATPENIDVRFISASGSIFIPPSNKEFIHNNIQISAVVEINGQELTWFSPKFSINITNPPYDKVVVEGINYANIDIDISKDDYETPDISQHVFGYIGRQKQQIGAFTTKLLYQGEDISNNSEAKINIGFNSSFGIITFHKNTAYDLSELQIVLTSELNGKVYEWYSPIFNVNIHQPIPTPTNGLSVLDYALIGGIGATSLLALALLIALIIKKRNKMSPDSPFGSRKQKALKNKGLLK